MKLTQFIAISILVLLAGNLGPAPVYARPANTPTPTRMASRAAPGTLSPDLDTAERGGIPPEVKSTLDRPKADVKTKVKDYCTKNNAKAAIKLVKDNIGYVADAATICGFVIALVK
ncbi:hypothetical protein BJ085DRAFT_31423 [Dimargaris cristalligena]|uniref:Uncharacterized protein n=1 Tax=Dimargaris cristalligena TaxID=215637 RepID=A0A4P9ZRD3_9FUNG|nr:hypothetical protein BJ085DRAFT_31423 [Dimargaris cristalligena]|eukprot:RKP36086.1 hypothetical protein BJ085DRAFT_31423 [Dimargaris cristalligena]